MCITIKTFRGIKRNKKYCQNKLHMVNSISSSHDSTFKGSEVKIFCCPATVMGYRQRMGACPATVLLQAEREGALSHIPLSQETLG